MAAVHTWSYSISWEIETSSDSPYFFAGNKPSGNSQAMSNF